jgi:hypothetical protein
LLICLGAGLLWLAPRLWRRHRRAVLRKTPLPREFEAILRRNVHCYGRLPELLRDELHGHIKVFLDEKNFFGCDGMAIDDEVRVTIAGNACLLLLNRKPNYFPGFSSILVYPDTYVAMETVYEGPVEVLHESARHGESWQRGPVVLSWQDILRGLSQTDDGQNVVLHEFAHKLDEENEIADGLPILENESQYTAWMEVFSKEYAALERWAANSAHPVLDDYALESPAEFFAVATESFFEKPARMKAQLPELYEQLKRYYRVDPAAW